MIGSAIRDSQVLSTKKNFSWDWHLIGAVLQWPDESLRKLDDQNVIRYHTRIVMYLFQNPVGLLKPPC